MDLDLIPRTGRRLFLLLRLCLLAALIAPLGLTLAASGEAVQITPPPPPAVRLPLVRCGRGPVPGGRGPRPRRPEAGVVLRARTPGAAAQKPNFGSDRAGRLSSGSERRGSVSSGSCARTAAQSM